MRAIKKWKLCHAGMLLACVMTGVQADAGETTILHGPGKGNNRIVVSGNSASDVGCGKNVSVNSVNIDAAKLQGRTVIVRGRNVQDVRAGNCDDASGEKGVSSNVNSDDTR